MGSFGENLRRERELRGIGLNEIAEATKISVRFLQALESDRVDLLPGGLFRRTFVRQYARYVGLDPERMVAEFLFAHGEEAAEMVAKRPRFSLSPQGALSAAAASLVVIWLAYPWTRSDPDDVAADSGPVTTVPREFVYPPAAPPPPSTLPPATTPTAAATAATTESAGDDLTLSLAAQQDCWVRVTVDGETVLDRVLMAGEQETLAAEGEIVLSVGNAGGVTFRVNDRPGVPLGKNGEVKKNIVITRQSLPSLVEKDPPSDTPPSG